MGFVVALFVSALSFSGLASAYLNLFFFGVALCLVGWVLLGMAVNVLNHYLNLQKPTAQDISALEAQIKYSLSVAMAVQAIAENCSKSGLAQIPCSLIQQECPHVDWNKLLADLNHCFEPLEIKIDLVFIEGVGYLIARSATTQFRITSPIESFKVSGTIH